MSGFTQQPKLIPLASGREFVLAESITYRENGHTITVPALLRTDFASIPRPLWSIISPLGRHLLAALVHDWLYWEQGLSRAEADRVFLKIMEQRRVLLGVRLAMYYAVRAFGWLAWNSNAAAKERGDIRVLVTIPDVNMPSRPRGLDRVIHWLHGRAA
jgi:hypothetical protein